MLKFCFSALAILVSVQVANAQQARNCQTGRAIIESGFDAPSTMTVRSGQTCRRNFKTTQFKLESIQFLQMPSHGTLKKVGAFGYAYTAKKGYVGADSFHVRYVGSKVDRAGNKSFDTFQGLKWTVNVVP
jgi:hypothetical protein